MQPNRTNQTIPVTLLTGFLGSGKTTVLNRLLKRLPLTAVVMNEFGEVGLDHQLLEEQRGPLALLSGGCVCCQVQGALAPTLKNLWLARDKGDLPPFERLIIETTGIADPAPIIATLVQDRWLAARYRLDGIVTTVDAVFAAGQLTEHAEARRQIAVADRLLLTKTDLADAGTIERLKAALAELNPAAPILSVLNGELEPDAILGAERRSTPTDAGSWLAAGRYRPAGQNLLGGRPAPAPGHAERIRAFSLTFEQPLDPQAVSAALEMLIAFRPTQLLRMKAILNLVGEPGPVVLHGVQHVLYPPSRLESWPDEDRRSRFVFIVDDLEESFVAKLLADFTQATAQHYPSSQSVA
ncbi:MAG TPA: GTP-binding protein [Parasulfuritortus sp.]